MTHAINILTIREALPNERQDVIAVTVAAYEQYAAVMPPKMWDEYVASIRETLSNDASGTQLVAVEHAVVVGSVLLVPPSVIPARATGKQEYPEIRLVAVAPEARHRGIATALIQACIDSARADGFHRIGLHTTKYMGEARQLYEWLGFVRAPEFDFQAPAGLHVPAFRLDFNGSIARSAIGPEASKGNTNAGAP